MNVYSACIRLGVWNIAKARASVWSLSNNNDHTESLSDMKETIKKCYKKLALNHHPDVGGDKYNFLEIQEAYDTIKKANCRDFVSAIDDEKKSLTKYYDPGSEQCSKCNRWSDITLSCITVTCSGFLEPPPRKFSHIKGQTKFGSFLGVKTDTAQ